MPFFISLRKAGPNPARRSPITLSAAILSLPIGIEKGGIFFSTLEFPCRSEEAFGSKLRSCGKDPMTAPYRLNCFSPCEQNH